MPRPLTKQQQAVYDFIRDKILTRGYGPTVREIGLHMNIKSPNGVMSHLRALERKAMISRAANKSRAIELTEPITRLLGPMIPVAAEVIDSAIRTLPDRPGAGLDVAAIASGKRQALRVQDDSLASASIAKGDLLLIDDTVNASDGRLVVARVEGGEQIVRYFFQEQGRTRLQPVGQEQLPILGEEIEVAGVVIGVIRDLGDLF